MNDQITNYQIPDFVTGMQEVSSIKNGAKVLFATDDFFAVAENLLKPEEPYSNKEYTEFGKWMDGWETRRKRIASHDWLIIALAGLSNLAGICLDTSFFVGNYAPYFSLQATHLSTEIREIQNRKHKMGTAANNEDLKNAAKLDSEAWETLIPMTALRSGKPDTHQNCFKLNSSDHTFTHLRFNVFPDGGLARLRVYGQIERSLRNGSSLVPVGGECIDFSNAHYSRPDALLHPWPSKGMFDGWETARQSHRPHIIELDDNGFMLQREEEWAILKLEKSIYVNRIEIDTTHFIGNCPDSIKIEAAYVEPRQNLKKATWETILKRTKLLPNQTNGLINSQLELGRQFINHVKVTIAPDGGLARVRIYGTDI